MSRGESGRGSPLRRSDRVEASKVRCEARLHLICLETSDTRERDIVAFPVNFVSALIQKYEKYISNLFESNI